MPFTELGDAAAPCAVLAATDVAPAHDALLAATALAASPDALVGGPLRDGEVRLFGWMLGPVPCSPLGFELNAVALAAGGRAAGLAGPVDVVPPGLLVVPRVLLDHPLPEELVAAVLELTARARSAKVAVRCDPALACAVDGGRLGDADDRGRAVAVRAVAERHPDLRPGLRLPPALRSAFVEREVRLPGGRRTRTLVARPPVARIVHRAGDDMVRALRDELRVRGDRYVLVCADDAQPGDAALDALVDALESSSQVVAAAPDAASADGRCVMLAAGRIPQHLEPSGATLADALRAMLGTLEAAGRAVRAPGRPPGMRRRDVPRTASAIVLVASAPEVTRIALDAALAATSAGDELAGICAAGAETSRRMLGAYPGMRVITDGDDALLTGALNVALGEARGELVYVLSDDALLQPATLRTLAAAFARVPALGMAFPAVPGAALGEGIADVEYPDLKAMRALAERRAIERARDAEPLDAAGTPAFAIARETLHAVGGIDPAYGPTRRGIADLVARVRRAGYAVVRCDDTLVHRFDPALSRNALALADRRDAVPAAPSAADLARGLEPSARIPFAPETITAAHDAAPPSATACVVALPVANGDELERAASTVAAAAAAYCATDPVRVAVLLDGAVSSAEAIAALRPPLAACGRPMADTIAVRVERENDLAAWRARLDASTPLVVAQGLVRDAFGDCRTVCAHEMRALLETVAR